jgi:hypothetical protein
VHALDPDARAVARRPGADMTTRMPIGRHRRTSAATRRRRVGGMSNEGRGSLERAMRHGPCVGMEDRTHRHGETAHRRLRALARLVSLSRWEARWIPRTFRLLPRSLDPWSAGTDAYEHDKADVANLVTLYALVSRMRVRSSPVVVESADKVVRLIIETYLGPNLTLQDIEKAIAHDAMDPLRQFSDACREELQTLL